MPEDLTLRVWNQRPSKRMRKAAQANAGDAVLVRLAGTASAVRGNLTCGREKALRKKEESGMLL